MSVLIVQAMLSSGLTMIGPIVPILLPDLGVVSGPGIAIWTGVIMAITPLTAAVSSPFWSSVGHRIGRRRVLAITGGAVTVVALLMLLVTSAPQLFALRLVMGLFGGFAAAGLTLVAARAPLARLGYALGWLSAGQIMGALIGPVLGGVAADLAGSIRAPFVLTALLSALAGMMAILVIPAAADQRGETGGPSPSFRRSVGMIRGVPGLLALLVLVLCANAALRTAEPLVVLQTQRLLGDHGALATFAGFAVAIAGVGNITASPFLGRRSDVIGYRRTLMIALAGAALATAPQAFVTHYPLFVVERFCFGMFVGGVLPPLQALIARETAPDLRSSVFGLTSSAAFLGGSIGPLLGGFAAAALGLGAGFLAASLLFVACLVAVALTIPSVQRKVIS